ncbi:heterokaryon incompatibility protein-domain-containing protein [Apodospora peruviana]|uniref:Heterokaryon incompatibility protein-domain-containing protein n=1 Tax=Apodospora peruviana TaxID=516989 RepID=A0AAE0MA51_9PEZI|nr:heterokaryon incompatibility protein-domain-containing protein [Apodospora peruviana]
MTPSGREHMKKYGGHNWENTMTIGIEFVDGQMCVSYLRPVLDDLVHKLAKPAPGAKPHIYQPLPPGQVRFLRRVPNPTSVCEHGVVFDFVTCSLEDGTHPEYSAISYCWGDLPVDNHLVLGDGSYIPITAKAARILARIAVYAEHIWLDAVCINQADVAEKTLQIPLMASIYQSASSVEVWLGQKEGLPRVLSPSTQDPSISPGAQYLIDYKIDRHDPFSPYSPANVIDLIWSPWFERAWVAQEFCFGTNHRYHFGDVELHSLFFDMILKDLKSTRFSDDTKGQCQIPLPPMIRNFQTFRALRNYLQHTKQKNKLPQGTARLEDILCDFYGLKATDPRDKVFAMLNFVDAEAREDVKPDYTRHAADIYHDTMESVLFRGTSFRLIGFAGLAASRPLFADRHNTPSWIPDLSTPPPHTVWSSDEGGTGGSRRFKPTALLPKNSYVVLKCYHIFNARLSPVSVITTPDDNTTAKIELDKNYEHQIAFIVPHGKRIATVADVLPGDRSQNIAHLPRFLSAAILRTPHGEGGRDALWKTLVAENPDCVSKGSAGAGFDRLCELLLTQPKDEATSSGPESTTGTKSGGVLPSSLWKDDTPEGRYFQAMLLEGAGSTRGLFWTAAPEGSKDEEGFVGLAANGVQPGDEVWLIVGARVPFILRRREQEAAGGEENNSEDGSSNDMDNMMSKMSYSLVCEAYVHGIMHVEADIAGESKGVILF